jgi:hypothetical protein
MSRIVPMTDLPMDTIRLMAEYLSVRDVARLRVTCKRMNTGLKDPVVDRLKPHQLQHYYMVKDCLQHSHYAMDASLMGRGKTYVACALALTLKLSLTVVCPKTMIGDVWKQVAALFGIKDVVVITYTRIRMKNEYVEYVPTRSDPFSASGVIPGGFQASKSWKERVNRRTLLVLDESQNLKNKDTRQYQACLALAKTVHAKQGRSRLMLLSATPIDKEEQVQQIFRLTGVMTKDQLARFDIMNGYVLEGIQEVIDHCPLSAAERTAVTRLINKSTKHTVLLDLFVRYFRGKYCFAMPPPVIEARLDIKNGFYRMSQPGEEAMKRAVKVLSKGLDILGEGGVGAATTAFPVIGKALEDIEGIKLEVLERKTREILSLPRAKVVLVMNKKAPTALLTTLLHDLNPVLLTSKITDDELRTKNIHRFQNDPSCRLLIGSLKIMALGISLHSIRGDYDPYMFIVPSYFVQYMHQAAYRVYRTGAVGLVTVRYVYTIGSAREARILEAIARKSQVMKKMSPVEGVKYPGEHEEEREE